MGNRSVLRGLCERSATGEITSGMRKDGRLPLGTVLRWLLLFCLGAIGVSNVVYFALNAKEEARTIAKLNQAVVRKAAASLRQHVPAVGEARDVGGTRRGLAKGGDAHQSDKAAPDRSDSVAAWEAVVAGLEQREGHATSALLPVGTATPPAPDAVATLMCADADPSACADM